MSLKFNKLTAKAVKNLSAGESLVEHGIKAQATASGDVRWSINVMVDGVRIHRVIGTAWNGVTRTQAEQAIEQLRTDARRDRLNLPKARKTHLTLRDASHEYLARLSSSGGRDLKNKRRNLQAHLVPFLGRDRLDGLTETRLSQYRNHRSRQGASDATINRELATLSHLLSKAASKDWGWICKDDKPPIPKAKEAAKKIRVLTPEECDRLLAAALADQDTRVWLFVLFGLNAAMRHSEIVARRYDDVDFAHCRIWINKAKAGEREQPITPTLRDALAARQMSEDDPDGWIFPSVRKDCKTPHRPDMREAFRRVCLRAGIDPRRCTPHLMRHTAISRLAMAGVDAFTIKRISGHKCLTTVERYVHLFGPHVDQAVSVLDTSR